jgi:chromosome partitioning protein
MHKAHLLTFAINKGGVGKTHVLFNLGLLISSGLVKFNNKKKPKVLVVDLDPQANVSNLFIKTALGMDQSKKVILEDKRIQLEEEGFSMSYNFLMKTSDSNDLSMIDDPLFMPDPEKYNLSVLIAKGDDAIVYHQIKSESPSAVAERLQYRLDALIMKEKFDIVLIDTPPSETQTELLAALHVASDILLPINWDGHSSEALGTMRRIIGEIQEERELNGDSVNVAGVLMNKLSNNSSQDREFRQYMNEYIPDYSHLILNTGFSNIKPWLELTHLGQPPWVVSSVMKYSTRKVISDQLKGVLKEIGKNLSDGVEYFDDELVEGEGA